MWIPQWDIGIYCVQCTRKSLKRAGRVGNHPGRELSSGAVRAAARVKREEKKRWRVEKRDSVEEAKEQAYQPGINKILRATEW